MHCAHIISPSSAPPCPYHRIGGGLVFIALNIQVDLLGYLHYIVSVLSRRPPAQKLKALRAFELRLRFVIIAPIDWDI